MGETGPVTVRPADTGSHMSATNCLTESVRDVDRRIRRGSHGRGSSSSPARGGRAGDGGRGSGSTVGRRGSMERCAVTLTSMGKRLAPSARLGEASIGGADLRTPAEMI
jgi:hypothetical protein